MKPSSPNTIIALGLFGLASVAGIVFSASILRFLMSILPADRVEILTPTGGLYFAVYTGLGLGLLVGLPFAIAAWFRRRSIGVIGRTPFWHGMALASCLVTLVVYGLFVTSLVDSTVSLRLFQQIIVMPVLMLGAFAVVAAAAARVSRSTGNGVSV